MLTGPLPNDYSSVSSGSATTTSSAPGVTQSLSTGGIVASTHQISNTPNNKATAGDNTIATYLTSTDDNTVTASPSVSSNTISASVTGNASQSTIAIASDNSPGYAGSAIVANVQESIGEGASIALNSGSAITGEVYAIDSDVNTLAGTLTVENNVISSSASNNTALGSRPGQAGNELLLDDTLSFSGNVASPSFSVTDGGSAMIGDLAVQNVQSTIGVDSDDLVDISAQTIGASVFGGVERLSSGAISVSGNAITATAQSNAASSKIANGDNAALFDGSAQVGNVQSNVNADIVASNLNGTITALVDDGFTASSAAADGNAVRASAYGNQVSQSADLKATTLGLGDAEASLANDLAVTGVSAILVGSAQTNANTGVAASHQSEITAQWASAADSTMSGSSLSASNNAQEAVAVGNSAGNGLTLEGTTIGSGAAITNFQASNSTSFVEAESVNSSVSAIAADSITGSELSVSDNLQRSIAYGASSGNTLSVDGTTLSVATVDSAEPSITTSLDTIDQLLAIQNETAYGVVNYQAQGGDVTATANSSSAFETTVLGSLENGSTLTTDGNTYVAATYGTDARNIASIDANSIDTQTSYDTTIAAVINAQLTSEADILARATGDTVVHSTVGVDVNSSAISTSENSIQALAVANRSSANQISVNATNIDAAAGSTARGNASFNDTTLTGTVDAAFAAQNAQYSSGSATASLLTEVNPASARILTEIGDDLISSSVTSDDNASSAAATGNRAATSILLDANRLNTSAVVQSAQMNGADLTALIGVAGTPGTPGDPGTQATPVSATGSSSTGSMSMSGNTLEISGEPVTVTFADHTFTAEQVAFLNSLTNVSGASLGGNTVTFTGDVDTSVFNTFQTNSGSDGYGSGDETITMTGFTIPGTPPTPPVLATPNQGGVTVAVGGDVLGSSVSVAGNTTSGSVIGNSASNAVVASATDIGNGSSVGVSEAALLSTRGDLALSNLQRDVADVESSSVYGTFAIDAVGGTIEGSSLSVSNNSQRSDAGSNLASNVIDASATNITAGTALTSSQVSSSQVAALSDLVMFAPGASSDSVTQISDNTNTARAVVNEATSVVQITATNVGPAGQPNLASMTGLAAVNADHAMLNVQYADGEASSAATSRIYNGDSEVLETVGLTSGSIEFAGNATTAQTVANLASNQMTVAGSANNGASAAINNGQMNLANVSADATSTVQVMLSGDESPAPLGLAASDSSIRVNNNATTGVARGNSASNVLNLEAGAAFGPYGAGTSTVDFASNGSVTAFTATAGVLNQQSNTGTVTANSTGASYQVALNGYTTSPTVTGSSLSVSGNAVNAEAYGNTASNRIVMTALNSGTPSAAIGNYQTNNAAVTATVTSVGYGVMAGSGVIGGSTFATTGNRVAATAIGNNAVSVISAGN